MVFDEYTARAKVVFSPDGLPEALVSPGMESLAILRSGFTSTSAGGEQPNNRTSE